MESVKKILVLGTGQMGGRYIGKLINDLGVEQGRIVGMDIDESKLTLVQQMFPNVTLIRNNPHRPLNDFVDLGIFDRAFLCSNTPTHQKLLVELMINGVLKIFVEKPLTMTLDEANAVRVVKMRTGASLHTAFLMNFSLVLEKLIERIKAEKLIAIQGQATWGKNRYNDSRSTPGDLQDEFVHPAGIYNTIIQTSMPKLEAIYVLARLTFLKFFRVDVQEEAFANDSSYPLSPNSSAYVLQSVHVEGLPEIIFQINSSYVMNKQVRRVELTLSSLDDPLTPVYAVEMNFDTKQGDVLDITRLEGNVVEETLHFPLDKLLEEANAFMKFVDTGAIDPRLTDYFSARMSVQVTDAIIESHNKGGKIIQAIGKKDVQWRSAVNS